MRPLEYLRIHPGKNVADWYLPSAVSLILTGTCLYFKAQVNLFGPGGTIAMILAFVQNLPGFYIAALAAIATFGRTDIDRIMPGNPPPSIETRTVTGKRNRIPVTRRRFLCLLFAYLTFECIVLTLASILGLSFVNAVRGVVSTEIGLLLFSVSVFVFFFLLSQMVVVTFWGLYYLGDRIHQPEA